MDFGRFYISNVTVFHLLLKSQNCLPEFLFDAHGRRLKIFKYFFILIPVKA